MASQDMIKLRNKKTGQIIEVPRSQFIEKKDKKGLSGVATDLSDSFGSLIPATTEMVKSIPSGINTVGDYATSHNPLSTLANLGAGGVESIAGILSSPQVLTRYLADKFPQIKNMSAIAKIGGLKDIKSPTPYESLMNLEQQHGLTATPEQGSVRGFGGLLLGGKALTQLPSMLLRSSAISAETAGRGGDPVHAAILALLADNAARALKKVPAAVNNAAGVPPEMPPPGGGAGGSPSDSMPAPMLVPSASMPSPMPAPMNAEFPVPAPKLPDTQPAGIKWNAQLPESVSWMQNIPQAALNVTKGGVQTAKNAVGAIPEVAGTAVASALEKVADLSPKATQGIVQPTLGALASYLKHLSVSPEELAKRKLFGDLKSTHLPMINERTEAANRLGLPFLTPSEATLSTFEAEKQGGIGRTSSGSQELYKKGAERTASEVDASNRFLDTIYNDAELAPEKKAAYEETMTGRVSPEFVAEHQKMPVVQDALKKLANNSAYRQIIERELGVPLDNINPKTFRYWDVVKRVLYDMEEGEKSNIGKATTTSSEIGNTRRKMVKQMDDIKPEYKVARGISERQQVRTGLEHHFDKRQMTLNNWDKYLGSTRNYDTLVRKLEGNPEAQQMLKDIHLLGGNIIPNEMNIRTAAKMRRTGMSTPRNKFDALKQELDERHGQEHDVATVKLMTNADWPKMLAEHLKNK